MNKKFEQIAEEISTKEELVFFVEEIDLLQDFIFKNTKVPLSERVKDKVAENFRKYIKELEDEGFLSGSPDDQLAFFDDLKDYLQKIPLLKLEIAFSPPHDFLDDLRRWFKEENDKKFIFDITVNPRVIGGAIIEYKGQYRDFSLLEKMNRSVYQMKS